MSAMSVGSMRILLHASRSRSVAPSPAVDTSLKKSPTVRL